MLGCGYGVGLTRLDTDKHIFSTQPRPLCIGAVELRTFVFSSTCAGLGEVEEARIKEHVPGPCRQWFKGSPVLHRGLSSFVFGLAALQFIPADDLELSP